MEANILKGNSEDLPSHDTRMRREKTNVRQEWESIRRQENDDYIRLYQKYHHPDGPYQQLEKRGRLLDEELRTTSPHLLAEIQAQGTSFDVCEPTYVLLSLGEGMQCCYKPIKKLFPASWINPGSDIPDFDPRDIPAPGSVEWRYILARSHAIQREYQNRLRTVNDVLEWLTAHEAAGAFLKPVDSMLASGYYDVVKNPMDITTLGDGDYESHVDFLRQTKLIFDNCRLYSSPDSVLVRDANRLEEDLLRELKKSPEFNEAIKAYHTFATPDQTLPENRLPSADQSTPLPNHVRRAETRKQLIETSISNVPTFACPSCQYRAHSATTLRLHMKSRCKGYSRFICAACGVGYNSVQRLKEHREQCHPTAVKDNLPAPETRSQQFDSHFNTATTEVQGRNAQDFAENLSLLALCGLGNEMLQETQLTGSSKLKFAGGIPTKSATTAATQPLLETPQQEVGDLPYAPSPMSNAEGSRQRAQLDHGTVDKSLQRRGQSSRLSSAPSSIGSLSGGHESDSDWQPNVRPEKRHGISDGPQKQKGKSRAQDQASNRRQIATRNTASQPRRRATTEERSQGQPSKRKIDLISGQPSLGGPRSVRHNAMDGSFGAMKPKNPFSGPPPALSVAETRKRRK